MSKKTFDSKTAKKIINEYAEKINILTRENNELRKQLEDSMTTLKINKEIMYSQLGKQSSNYEVIIEDLKNENNRLSEKINWLFSEKIESSKTIYKLQEELQDANQKKHDTYENDKTKYFIDSNKLLEKENQILLLKKQIKALKEESPNDIAKTKEIFIGEPNKFNLELNNELVQTTSLLKKYNALLHKEIQTTKKLKKTNKDLEQEIDKLKSNVNSNINTNKVLTTNNDSIVNTNQNNVSAVNIMDCLFDNSKEDDDDSSSYSSIGDNNNLNVEDNNKNDIIFPDKVKNVQIKKNKIPTGKKVPKLDLSSVMKQYNKQPKIFEALNKKQNSDRDEVIDKLKAQIKVYKNTILKYKERIKKMREKNSELRNKNAILANMVKGGCSFNNKSSSTKDAGDDVSMNQNINEDSDRENDGHFNKVSLDNIEIKE